MIFKKRFIAGSIALAGLLLAGFSAPAFGQDATPPSLAMRAGSTIEVTGTGSAFAPADSAIVQLIVYSHGFVSYGIEEATDVVESDATPGAFSSYPDEFSMQPTVSADQLAAISDVLVGAGIAPEMIDSRPGDSLTTGYFGTGSAVIAFQIDATRIATVTDLVETARTAATDLGLSIDQVNISYQIDDCTAVNLSALTAALADAQSEANALAGALGIELGDLVKVSKQSPYEGLYLALLTSFSPCERDMTLDDAFTSNFTGFPSNKDGMIEIYSVVVLTYKVL